MPKTLGYAIRDVLCLYNPKEKVCNCNDPWPVTYYCAYGDCVIYRCRNCGGIISRTPGRCDFPYSR
jgi:hypothetical protein